MPEEILVALSTFPDAETARRVAEKLVAKNLVACANITAQVESVYRWKGEIETGKEALVLFKVTADRYDPFEKELKALHPYEVPEIIALPVTRGSPEYLHWVSESCAVPL
jgi:periplasmic divalent cation tolerance protein